MGRRATNLEKSGLTASHGSRRSSTLRFLRGVNCSLIVVILGRISY